MLRALMTVGAVLGLCLGSCTPSASGGVSACYTLQSCCAGMTDQASCGEVAAEGDVATCNSLLSSYQVAGLCAGDGGAASARSETKSGHPSETSNGSVMESAESTTTRETGSNAGTESTSRAVTSRESSTGTSDVDQCSYTGESHAMCDQYATKFCSCTASGGIEPPNCIATVTCGCNEEYDSCIAVLQCILGQSTCDTNCQQQVDSSCGF